MNEGPNALLTTLGCMLVSWLGVGAVGQDGVGAPSDMDKLLLADETIVTGLLLSESDRTVEFAQLTRPAGRPMQAIIRPYPREQVVQIQRARQDDRERLERQFTRLRHRAEIEADHIERIQLDPISPGRTIEAYADAKWRYAGAWFELYTSLPPSAAKQTIVQIEQIFRAYRQLLPPRREPQKPIVIYLVGDAAEYRRMVDLLGLETTSPAFFLPGQNRIVASSRLGSLTRRKEKLSDEHAALRRRQEQSLEQFPEQFAKVAAELASQGYSSDEIADEKRARQAALQRQVTAVIGRVDAAERRNQLLFAKASHESMRRLYHEAFHAYLENYVFDGATMTVPRWLNEGLAQLFEYAQLDGGLLRIDVAPAELLKAIRRDIQRRPLPLTSLLDASSGDFHGRKDPELALRMYTYAWGVAYYLTYLQHHKVDELLESLQNPPADAAYSGLSQVVSEKELQQLIDGMWRQALLDAK